MVCESCNRSVPTHSVTLYQNIGMIAAFRYRTLKGALCKACVAHYFWEYTLVTLALGWWGVISFVLTPLILVNNLFYFLRSQVHQPQPTLDLSAAPLSTIPEPCPRCHAFQASDTGLSRSVWASIIVSLLLLVWAGYLSLRMLQQLTPATNWIVVALFLGLDLCVAVCFIMLVRHPLRQCTQCQWMWPKHTT